MQQLLVGIDKLADLCIQGAHSGCLGISQEGLEKEGRMCAHLVSLWNWDWLGEFIGFVFLKCT